MTQYKAGQTVEVVTSEDWSAGFQNGSKITLERLIPGNEAFAGEWDARAANGAEGIIREENFRPMPIGPVVTETVTKTRIVPGVYDHVTVGRGQLDKPNGKRVEVTFDYWAAADELDAAAAVLSALAKGLRDA